MNYQDNVRIIDFNDPVILKDMQELVQNQENILSRKIVNQDNLRSRFTI